MAPEVHHVVSIQPGPPAGLSTGESSSNVVLLLTGVQIVLEGDRAKGETSLTGRIGQRVHEIIGLMAMHIRDVLGCCRKGGHRSGRMPGVAFPPSNRCGTETGKREPWCISHLPKHVERKSPTREKAVSALSQAPENHKAKRRCPEALELGLTTSTSGRVRQSPPGHPPPPVQPRKAEWSRPAPKVLSPSRALKTAAARNR